MFTGARSGDAWQTDNGKEEKDRRKKKEVEKLWLEKRVTGVER